METILESLTVDSQIYAVDIDRVEEPDASPAPDFIKSIGDEGQLEPVELTLPSEDEEMPEGVDFKIVKGRRRIAALIANDVNMVRATVVVRDAESAAAATLIENLHRDRNPIVEANAIALLAKSRTPEEISKELHIDLGLVKDLVEVHKRLHPKLVEKVTSGAMTFTAAKKIVAMEMPKREQAKLAKEEVVRIKDVDAVRRQNFVDAFESAEQVEIPTLTPDEELANEVEAAALKRTGKGRSLLIDAAELLRGGK